jgi:hypothetical protein
MDKFIPEAGIRLGIKYPAKPIDYYAMSFGCSEFGVVR